ncbi:rhodanese-like domain-containing protein [Thalassospiraceae bacterium LMO-JJ14]|nr:rhodanese-like domain-containing protein [Thalassospiraceae bacterium LMO-JJ14]
MPPATPSVQEIDAATAKSWLDAGTAVLLDVREDQELAEARIAGATHNAMSSFNFDNIPKEAGKKVIVMCAHGMRSLQVADYLLHQGMLDEAYSLNGGIVAWAQSGFPYERG